MSDQAIALIREFGFPTFIVMWFMFRLEKRLDRQVELLGSLMQATALLAKAVETNHRRAPELDELDSEKPTVRTQGDNP